MTTVQILSTTEPEKRWVNVTRRLGTPDHAIVSVTAVDEKMQTTSAQVDVEIEHLLMALGVEPPTPLFTSEDAGTIAFALGLAAGKALEGGVGITFEAAQRIMSKLNTI